MTAYAAAKLVHILSATLLFGTGLGSAFFMFRAWRSRDRDALRTVARSVVAADWIFTAPAVVVQLLTGLWLADYLHIPLHSTWLLSVLVLYVFVGLCWLPVVWIQLRVRDLSAAGAPGPSYERLMQCWTLLGGLAFSAVLVIFYLMVFKPGLHG